MRKEARSLKATLYFLHLIPGLGLLLLETKAGMSPGELGGGGSAYTELWEHILSASAGSSEGVDQSFSGESEHPGKSAKMLTHFTSLATAVTVLIKESLWVQSYLVCSAAVPHSLYKLGFFFFFYCNPLEVSEWLR